MSISRSGRRILGLALAIALGGALHAQVPEVTSLDEWWTAYDNACKAEEMPLARALVHQHKRYAAMAFRDGISSYRQYRDRKDAVSMRQFYQFLELLSRHIEEIHGIDSYARDLAETVQDDTEILGTAKRREDAEIVTTAETLTRRFIERLGKGEVDRAKSLILDNPGHARLFYLDLLQEVRRATEADDRQRVLGVHGFLAPLQEFMQESKPGDKEFEQYDPPDWVLALAAKEARASGAEPSGPDPVEVAREQVARGVALCKDKYWEEAVGLLEGARDTLEYSGVTQHELIQVNLELARCLLDWQDYFAAARAYREMARAAAWIGEDEAVKEARKALDDMPQSRRPGMDSADNWGRWKTSKLESVLDSKDDPYGPLREADPRVELWKTVDLTVSKRGEIGPPGVALVRLQSKVQLDTDGDGEGDVDPDFEKGTPVEFVARYPDGSTQPYAMSFRKFDSFDYLGKTFDFTRRTIVFCRRVGFREGKVGSARIRITDDDCNGRFDGYGKDGLVIDKSGVGTKLSRIFSTGRDIYEIDVHPTGASLEWRKYQGPKQAVTAFAAVGEVRNFIIASADHRDVFVELDGSGKPSLVPYGRWRFHEALLTDSTETDSVWVSHRTCEVIDVNRGSGPQSFEIGRGFTYDWDVSYDPARKELTIHGLSFEIRDGSGAGYHGFYPEMVMPLITMSMDLKDGKNFSSTTARAQPRSETAASYRDLEYFKDMVYELEVVNRVGTKIQVGHPIVGEWITGWRAEKISGWDDPSTPEIESGSQKGEKTDPGGGDERVGGDGPEDKDGR